MALEFQDRALITLAAFQLVASCISFSFSMWLYHDTCTMGSASFWYELFLVFAQYSPLVQVLIRHSLFSAAPWE
jgi:hypothetical protein